MNNVVLPRPIGNQTNRIAEGRVRPRENEKWGWLIVFSAAHIPLALLIFEIKPVATAHAVISLIVGLWWALSGSRHLSRVVYTAAYIAGAEVFWRMTGASIYWEFGKYAISILFLVAMFRNGRFKRGGGPLFYFAVLLPSAILTIQAAGWAKSFEAFSFNLTGPFALFVCGWFFSNIKLTTPQLQKLLLFFASPALGIAGVAQYVMRSSEYIRFTSNASNFATSGGFGPNQVSSILGLGALAFFLFFVAGKIQWNARLFALVAMLFLAAQSALTFSRGGLYNVVGAIGLASIYFIRDPRTRAKFLPLVAVAVLAISVLIIPYLDKMTAGALSARFRNTDTTNRSDIALAQLEVWKNHPILGVGPGQARYYADQVAHTEVTRLLAEHGIFGLLALLALLFMAARNLKRAPTLSNKAMAAAMMSWSFLFMLNAGMRLAAPSFAFGLSFLLLIPEKNASMPVPNIEAAIKQPSGEPFVAQPEQSPKART